MCKSTSIARLGVGICTNAASALIVMGICGAAGQGSLQMRADRAISWFKRGVQCDAKISYDWANERHKRNITVFSYGDNRNDAIRDVISEAERYGYTNITVEHMVYRK